MINGHLSWVVDFINETATDIEYNIIRTEKRIEFWIENFKNFWLEICFRDDGYDIYIVEFEAGKNRENDFRPMQLNEFTGGSENPYQKKLYYELDKPCYPYIEKQKLKGKIIQLIEVLRSEKDN